MRMVRMLIDFWWLPTTTRRTEADPVEGGSSCNIDFSYWAVSHVNTYHTAYPDPQSPLKVVNNFLFSFFWWAKWNGGQEPDKNKSTRKFFFLKFHFIFNFSHHICVICSNMVVFSFEKIKFVLFFPLLSDECPQISHFHPSKERWSFYFNSFLFKTLF